MRDANTTSATRTGSMMGTPAYMAREQALGLSKEIDGRTDLWAVGATMFTLLSGQYVHEAETAESMMVFSATRPARPLATVALDVPAPLCAVVDRALAFDKADRYPDASTMLAALEAACRASFGSAPVVRGSGPPAPAAPFVAPGATAAMGPPVTVPSIAHPQSEQSPLASSAFAGASGSGPAGFFSPGVSTTAGVSGLPRARAVDGPAPPTLFTPYIPSAPSPPRVGKAPAILAGVAVVLALVASVGVGLKYRVKAKAAPATSVPVADQAEPSSASPAVALTTTTAERAALAPTTSASASTASTPDGGAAAPVIEGVAKSRPAAPVAAGPVAAPLARRHDAPPPSPPVISPPIAPEPPAASPPPPPVPVKPKPAPTNPLDMKPITQ
jgi:serine/threonine-protein kinase